MSAGLLRLALFFALWVVLIGTAPADLAAGIVPAIAAAWTSLRLLPPGRFGVRFGALPRYAARFLRQSVSAGWDVARRAFASPPAPRTGFVRYTPERLEGTAREAFASTTALLPGTVPVGDDGAALTYHCLDIAQPVVDDLRNEEAAFARIAGEASTHA
jgi:multicomponent Na+:H+ antiporter subunit E